jgi:transposase-like protein
MLLMHNLIDEAKCFQTLREMRWPNGVLCPGCGSSQVKKHGKDQTQPLRQRYRCAACSRPFDDWTDTLLAGHHQPLRLGILCLYGMGLNRSNQQIAQELGLNKDDVQPMTSLRREGIVAKKPSPSLRGAVECEAVYIVAGHKGDPEAVQKRAHGEAQAAHRCSRSWHSGEREATPLWYAATGRGGGDSDAGECAAEDHRPFAQV